MAPTGSRRFSFLVRGQFFLAWRQAVSCQEGADDSVIQGKGLKKLPKVLRLQVLRNSSFYISLKFDLQHFPCSTFLALLRYNTLTIILLLSRQQKYHKTNLTGNKLRLDNSFFSQSSIQKFKVGQKLKSKLVQGRMVHAQPKQIISI